MNLLVRLTSRFIPRPLLAAPPLLCVDASVDPVPDGIDALPGCGWFDSSHELQCGLWVREHATPDTLAPELPLASWLELHLCPAHVTQPT